MIVYFTLTVAVLALLLLVKKNTVSECAGCGRIGFHRGMTRQDAINAIVLAGLTQDVDTIRGDLDKPDGFLYRNTEHIYDTFVWLQNNYMTI